MKCLVPYSFLVVMKYLTFFFTLMTLSLSAQESVEIDTFFTKIPVYTGDYSGGTVAARMIDGLGFRFYWATEGLTDEDYAYSPGPESRSTGATLDHILGLSGVILNATRAEANGKLDTEGWTNDQKRSRILSNLKAAREILINSSDKDLEDYQIIFERGDSRVTYDFWYAINGPIADAMWHTGQIVSYRRLSGNPFDGKVSVLQGIRRD